MGEQAVLKKISGSWSEQIPERHLVAAFVAAQRFLVSLDDRVGELVEVVTFKPFAPEAYLYNFHPQGIIFRIKTSLYERASIDLLWRFGWRQRGLLIGREAPEVKAGFPPGFRASEEIELTKGFDGDDPSVEQIAAALLGACRRLFQSRQAEFESRVKDLRALLEFLGE